MSNPKLLRTTACRPKPKFDERRKMSRGSSEYGCHHRRYCHFYPWPELKALVRSMPGKCRCNRQTLRQSQARATWAPVPRAPNPSHSNKQFSTPANVFSLHSCSSASGFCSGPIATKLQPYPVNLNNTPQNQRLGTVHSRGKTMTAGSYAQGHKFGAMLAGLYQDSLHQCSACSDFAQDPPCSYTSGT